MTEKPKSLKQQLKHATDNWKSYQARNEQVEKELVQERRNCGALADEAKKARAQHDDLKQRLYSSEMELARLRGYMERVREDDAVADPLIEVIDQHGTRQVSKRFPTSMNRAMSMSQAMAAGYEPEFDGYGNKREKHWTSY